MAEDALDFALDSGMLGSEGRDVDMLLQFGGNALGTGSLLALAMTCATGGFIMAGAQREPGKGGSTVTMCYIMGAVMIILAGIWLVVMLLLSWGALTSLALKIINKILGHFGSIAKRLEGPALTTFARVTMAEWFNHIWAVFIGVACIFLGPAVSAMTDSVKHEYKDKAKEQWITLSVGTMWAGIVLGGFHIFLVIT